MSGFIGELVNEFTHRGGSQQSQGYGQGQSNEPPLPPGWIARWNQENDRYIYINEQTGEQTFERPYNRGGQSQGYGQGGGYGGGYGGGGYEEERPRREGHGMGYGVAGAGVGLAGGAMLMHEGAKVEQDWDRDKYRTEQDVENFPDNAANWTGRKVGEVEDIPQDVEQDYDRAKYGVENKFDNAEQDVENFPDNAANWAGRKVDEVEDIPQDIGQGFEGAANWVGDKFSGVERFGDGVEGSFDSGEAQGRDDGY